MSASSMEHKAWLWRRKSSEKVLTKNEKSDLLSHEQELEKSLELERSLKDLKEQLYTVRTESDAKDSLLAKQKKVAEEAIAGWEKAETEAESYKKELADALLLKVAAEARIANIDANLNECMKQLQVVKEEHQHTIIDAATKLSRLQEKARLLETSLVEKNESIEAKDKLIEDLYESKSQTEAIFTEILARLESSEKDNASLKYEVFMLQKEIEVRNQDRDFHIKAADAAHSKYHDCVKKISKLEAECQRLRVMLRKRLPGPASIAKMRSEVSRDYVSGDDYDSLSTRVVSLVERVNAVEDESKVLKETLVRKNNELQSLRSQLEESSKRKLSLELRRRSFSNDLPLAAISEDIGRRNEDAISCAESWASALISEIEHFRNGKATTPSTTTAGVSELSLMDDFIEMEKLAIVCVDKKPESSNMQHASIKGHPSDIEKPLCKMIQMVEGIIQKSFTSNVGQQILDEKDESSMTQYKSFLASGCVAHVFLWEVSELCNVLQNFIVVCNDLFHGKVDFKKFIGELASTLEWIVNRCHSLQDLSTTKDTMKNLLNGDELHEDTEFKSGPSISEAKLLTLNNSNRSMEEKHENQKSIAEDVGTRLTVSNAELRDVRRSFSSLEAELEGNGGFNEELDTKCLELQLQLESGSTKETPKSDKGEEEKQLRTDWEISEASEKLAECQATILNLGKQLQALAAPKDASLFDKVISPTPATRINYHPPLLDQTQDNADSTPEHLKSPKTKEMICTEVKQPSPAKLKDDYNFNEQKGQSDAGKLVIVSRRQKGGVSFLKKLLSRRKESNKKKALPIGSS
ncbi:uncharacterized protein A4U43_C08F17970 [Asparagus officinalis]|uniref:filament-like plant protein 7 n=1 Tax=Asparagus officinalis TaxID=4686 RepID=UPI00098E4D32|nr:filament-like plant protein 7 [Asparagus officinalis]ONK60396.1 uncharacterized protein A4U43_C08F17970 [Asparagus officinalis]